MSIPVGNTDVDRTLEILVRTPQDGRYELIIQRHVIDLTTMQEVSKDLSPMIFTLEEMLADEQLALLIQGLPDVIDRLVTSRRAAIEAAVVAQKAAEQLAAEAAELERQRLEHVAALERDLLWEQVEVERQAAVDVERSKQIDSQELENVRVTVEAEMRAAFLAAHPQ